jgi:hydroxypyruvate reductase
VDRADPSRAVAHELDGMDAPDAVLALGKAAIAMARPVLDRHGPLPCIVVTNPENVQPLEGARVMAGSHPVPDEASSRAGQALLAAASGVGAGRRALVLISGGGSALAATALPPASDADLAALSRLLLGAGLDIEAMNRVRRAVGAVGGGGLARALAPASAEVLVLSDVVGDDLSAIASGPCHASTEDHARSAETLRAAGLWDRVPPAVRALLSGPPPPETPRMPHRIVGSNRLSAEAMLEAAPGAWLDPEPLVGDVSEAALRVAHAARRGPGTMLWGGETTVVLRGGGRGGRNQELALRVAMALEGLDRPWAFLSGGTDGRDGPTDAAGAVVDGGTLARARQAGIDPEARLAENDSYPVLDAAGDLLRIGATGTNVADLQILRVG